MKVTWNYANPSVPSAEELLREISGRAIDRRGRSEGQDQGAGEGG